MIAEHSRVLPTVNTFWIGSDLGEIHAACLRSWLRHGHRVVLHAYPGESPKDVPPGVEVFDASRLLPRERIVRHRRTRSLALGSDIYRYEILAAGLGLYADCDMYCVRPVEDADYIMGWEDDDAVGSALLKMPAGSHLLHALRNVTRQRHFIPPWLSERRRFRYRTLAFLGLPTPVERMPWGVLGPLAVTYNAKALDVVDPVAPRDVYYPIHWKASKAFIDPGLTAADILTHRTRAVHLWHTRQSSLDIPPGSPLAMMVADSFAAPNHQPARATS